jgi:hypothetical protein
MQTHVERFATLLTNVPIRDVAAEQQAVVSPAQSPVQCCETDGWWDLAAVKQVLLELFGDDVS